MKINKIILMILLLASGIILSQNQIPYGVISTGAGKVSGTTNIINFTIGEAFIGKTSSSNNIASMGFWNVYVQNTITSVEEEDLQPTEFRLEQNYPNPFNPSTKIRFTIPTSPQSPPSQGGEAKLGWFVTLKVYDILGNEVATLVNEEKPTGRYEVEFSAGHLASGIYLCRMQAGNYVSIKKMMLLK